MGTIPSYPLPTGPLAGDELIPAWKDGQQIAVPAVKLFGDSPAIAVEQAQIATDQATAATQRAAAAADRASAAAASAGTATDQASIATAAAAAAGRYVGSLAAPGGAAQIGYGGRTAKDKLDETPSIADAGAAGDGATDDGPVFAAQTVPFRVPRQDHYIGEDRTIDVSVELLGGARLIVPPGVTVSFRGSFRADLFGACFAGTDQGRGTIDLRQAHLFEAAPEWWGYDADSGWAAAIEAAMIAHPRVRLQNLVYALNRTLNLQERSMLIGQGNRFSVPGSGTLLSATFGDATVVQAGVREVPPGSTGPNDALFRSGIQDLHIARSVAATASDDCRGLDLGFTTEFYAKRVSSDGSRYSFSASLATHARIENCQAKLSVKGGLDAWTGFYFGGTPLSAINNNPSVYLVDCSGACSPSRADLPNTTHLHIAGNGTDFFQKGEFETVGGSAGVQYDPTGTTEGSSNDMKFDSLTIDQYFDVAFKITGLQNYGRVVVKYLYAGVAAGGAGLVVSTAQGSGSLCIKNGEAYMAQSTAEVACPLSNLVAADISIFISEARRGFSLSNIQTSKIHCIAFSQSVPMSAAIQLADHCTDNEFSMQAAAGSANNITYAYQSLDPTNDRNKFYLTMVGRAAVSQKTLFAAGAEQNSTLDGVQ